MQYVEAVRGDALDAVEVLLEEQVVAGSEDGAGVGADHRANS